MKNEVLKSRTESREIEWIKIGKIKIIAENPMWKTETVCQQKIFELNLIQINNLENDIQESFKYQKKVE